jgi:hypothetical protein
MSADRLLPVRAIRGVCLLAAALVLSACGRVETVVGAELGNGLVTSVYFEAESGQLSGGFTIQTDPDASGGKYILPPAGVDATQSPGAASAKYTFNVGLSATYLLWGRIHSPGALNNSFWLRIDDGPFYQWRLSTGVIWFWGAVHSGTDYGHPIPFLLAAGTHRLEIRNSEPDVGLDRLYVTADGDVPPGNTTPCNPPHSIQLVDGGCEPSCGSHGDTTCGSTQCAGQMPLVAYDCYICCHVPDGGADAGADATADAISDAPAEALSDAISHRDAADDARD